MPVLGKDIQSSRDVFLDVNESTLSINFKSSGLLLPLLENIDLYERIKPSETIWYIDEDELVVNLKKVDSDLKWPDIKETWESLAEGVAQLLKGTSVYVVGDSTDINQKGAMELAKGLWYAPLDTGELLESVAKKSITSWLTQEGSDSVAHAERAVLESLSRHVRAVAATLGGSYEAAGRTDMWRHLHAGFSVWISQSEASDELSAKEGAHQNIIDGREGYTKADVVVKLSGWDPEHAQTVAQSCLSALKQLILSDKELPGKKSLYIRLGYAGETGQTSNHQVGTHLLDWKFLLNPEDTSISLHVQNFLGFCRRYRSNLICLRMQHFRVIYSLVVYFFEGCISWLPSDNIL